MGHSIYMLARLFSYLLRLKEPKFITGYSGPEMDQAVLRGELDARVNRSPRVVAAQCRVDREKNWSTFTRSCRSPKRARIRASLISQSSNRLSGPIKSGDCWRLYPAFRIASATFITPPRTPPQWIRTLRDAITSTYNDPEFFKDYKKITGETPSPMMPDEFDVIIKKLPRNPEDVDLYKKLAGAGPLPGPLGTDQRIAK